MWFCLDALEYLRGGRIGAARPWSLALKIKPILTFGTQIAPSAKSAPRSGRWSGSSLPTSCASAGRR